MTEWHSLLPEDIIKSDDVGRIRSKGCWVSKKVPEEHVGLKAKDMLYEVRRKVIESEDGEQTAVDLMNELEIKFSNVVYELNWWKFVEDIVDKWRDVKSKSKQTKEKSDAISSDSICSYCRVKAIGCNMLEQTIGHITDCTAFIGRKLYTATKEE